MSQGTAGATASNDRATPLRPLRLGIVGLGGVSMSYDKVLRPARLAGDIEITMACDTDPGLYPGDDETRIDRMNRNCPGARFTTEYIELVTSPDVDVVLVLTSTLQHYEVAHAALSAGKHVLLEKPMAADLGDAARLVELARKAPGLLVCAPHIVLSPTYRRVWQHLQDGDIGRVVLARSRYGRPGEGMNVWKYIHGGGAIFELGVYNITALTGLLGPVKRVTAFAGTAFTERESFDQGTIQAEAIDNAHVLLDFGGCVYAAVTAAYTMNSYRGPALELYGHDGTIQILGDDWAPQGYEMRRGPGENLDPWELFPDEAPGWPWQDGVNHLLECARTGRRPVNTPEHAYHVLEVMTKAEEAGGDGCAREIESDFPPLALDAHG